jgi:hypothetical protein
MTTPPEAFADNSSMFLPALMVAGAMVTQQERVESAAQLGARLKVFYDCSNFGCYDDYIREEIDFVEHVRDRSDADVHVLVTTATTGARGREYTLAFIGLGAFSATSRTLTVTTVANDPDDLVRRRLVTAVTLGLLTFLAPDRVPPELSVEAEVTAGRGASISEATDPWNRWIFSVNGSGSIDAEESQREREWGLSFGADRVTPAWKISFGSSINRTREEFDLDEEDEAFSVERHNQSINWLVVRALSEHWSAGLKGQVRSSTFDNTKLDAEMVPAVEWNFFPYSMYTRRQLRVQYSAGAVIRRYYETTLFGKLDEVRAGQEVTTTYEQREPWGTLEGSVVASNYFPGFSQNRVSVDGELDVRITRGLSVSFEASASRIRDQLSLPRRDATSEEVLLRLRQLSSGFETRVEFGIEYQFGSRFASIVNPRFGQ